MFLVGGKGLRLMHQSTTMLAQQTSQSLLANTTSLMLDTQFVLNFWNGNAHE